MGTVIGVVALVLVVVAIWFGATCLLGWLAFLIYRSVAPEGWIEIGLWPWIGIMALATAVFGGGSKGAAS